MARVAHSFLSGFNSHPTRAAEKEGGSRGAARKRASRRSLQCEALEPRCLFSVYTVTSLADPATVTAGTLRWAVQHAAADVSGSSVAFASGLSGDITLTQGALIVNGANLSIAGPGASQLTMQVPAGSIFGILGGSDVSISGLTLANATTTAIELDGSATLSNCTLTNNVGALGGTVYETGSLTVSNCTFTQNTSTGFGGAIYAPYGAVTVASSTFSHNTAADEGGAICFRSYQGAALSIADSTFSYNASAQAGGAVEAVGDVLTVTNSYFMNNVSNADFGGAFDCSAGTLYLTGSTFAYNSNTDTAGVGGGFSESNEIAYVTNDTFATNAANSGAGLGFAAGTVTLTQDTIVGNSAAEGGGIAGYTSGYLGLFINNTIIASNTGGDVGAVISATNVRYDLIGDGSDGDGSEEIGQNTSFQNSTLLYGTRAAPLDPHVGSLAFNGGLTPTLELLAGSPAIDAGSNALSVDSGNVTLTTDQRGAGYARDVGFNVDMGSYEAPLLGNRAYVAGLFNTLLGRSIDQASLTYWTAQFNAGETQAQVAAAILSSNEYRVNQINAVYEQYLGRQVDLPGLISGLDVLQASGSMAQVAANVLGSDEFYASTGGGSTANEFTYVAALYSDLFGRAPQALEEDYWFNVFEDGSTTQTQGVFMMLESTEYQTDIITQDFANYLHRAPDAAGLAQYVSATNADASTDAVKISILTSAEYLSDVGAN